MRWGEWCGWWCVVKGVSRNLSEWNLTLEVTPQKASLINLKEINRAPWSYILRQVAVFVAESGVWFSPCHGQNKWWIYLILSPVQSLLLTMFVSRRLATCSKCPKIDSFVHQVGHKMPMKSVIKFNSEKNLPTKTRCKQTKSKNNSSADFIATLGALYSSSSLQHFLRARSSWDWHGLTNDFFPLRGCPASRFVQISYMEPGRLPGVFHRVLEQNMIPNQ